MWSISCSQTNKKFGSDFYTPIGGLYKQFLPDGNGQQILPFPVPHTLLGYAKVVCELLPTPRLYNCRIAIHEADDGSIYYRLSLGIFYRGISWLKSPNCSL